MANRQTNRIKSTPARESGLEICSGERVLIIDDSAFDRRMIRKAIAVRHPGIEFDELESGEEVSSSIQRTRPDIAILDIRMPGMDGFEVLAEIRSNPVLWDLPVVMVSGSEQPADRKLATDGGADGYFVKPPSAAAYFSLGQTLYDRFLCCEAR